MALNTRISFDQWITHIFDHPVTDPPWHRPMDIAAWSDADVVAYQIYWSEHDVSDTDLIAYLTRLFEECDTILQPFSDAQASQGLWLLLHEDYFQALKETDVSLLDRLRCINAMETLFEKCFARRCSPHLSHLDEPGINPLN